MEDKLARYQEIYARGLQDKLPVDKRAIAEELIKRGILQVQETASQPLNNQVQNAPVQQEPPKSPSDYIGPGQVIGEPALQMGTGMIGSAVGGLAGLGTLAMGGTAEEASSRIKSIQNAVTYQPRSPGGRAVSKIIAYPFEKGNELAGATGNALGGAAGQAIGETAFQSALVLAGRPWRLGAKAPITEANLTNELGRVVKTGIEKGIKPSLTGKATATQIDKYYSGATEAVRSIAKSKDALKFTNEFGEITEGSVPKNLPEFSQAIEQRKKLIFKDYDALQKATSDEGVAVDLSPVALELEKLSMNPIIVDLAPEAAAYAKQRLQATINRGAYTPAEAQEAVAILNESLTAYYKNPTREGATRASIDAMIANNLRSGLDTVIEQTTGPGYRQLKKEYGALKSIEKDVNKRMLIDARKAGSSTLNFYDVFSANDIIGGALANNPIAIAKGLGLSAISRKIKLGRDPNRAVRKMFEKSEPIVNQLESKRASAAIAAQNQLGTGGNP